jgi:cellulose synthase operon protein C
MMIGVEVPVPDPVADEPNSADPEGSPTPERSGPTVIFGGGNQSTPSREVETNPSAAAQPTPESGPRIIFGGPSPAPGGSPEATPTPVYDPMQMLKAGNYEQAEQIAMSKQDPDLARAIGWSLYNAHRYGEAEQWFGQAIQWNENDYESSYGLTLTLIRLGDLDKAEEVARWRMDQYPRLRTAMGDILTARAIAAYKAKEYRRSHELFAEVKTYRPLTYNEQVVDAWNDFQVGDYPLAATEFERLYSERPTKATASGLYASYARQKDWRKLKELAERYGGPLAQMYQDYLAEHYYSQHLYANAYATEPNRYPQLLNYTTPEASLSALGRYKSGDDQSKVGESRVDLGMALYVYDDINRIWFDSGWSTLTNGGVGPGAFVGMVPLTGPRVFVTNSPNHYNGLFDGRVGYTRLGEYTLSADVGITPAGGAVGPTVVGDLGLRDTEDWGNWSISFYRKPIKESILSYTGMKDPYSGEDWGRVTETGFTPTFFLLLPEDWSLSGSAIVAIRDGENVETNDHFAINFSLGHKIDNPNFSYFTIGPTIDYEQYTHNLDYFTFGQGGYFSPQYFLQGGLGVQLMTKEGINYLIRYSSTVGMQTYRQDASPVFPLENSTAVNAPSNMNTFSASVQLDGLVLITSQLAAGISIHADKTANYNEYSVGIFLKYFFQPRAGLFATDF